MQEKIYTDNYGNKGKLREFKKTDGKKYKLKKKTKKIIAIGLSIGLLFSAGKFFFKDDKSSYNDYGNNQNSISIGDSISNNLENYYNYSIEAGEDDIVQFKPLTLLDVKEEDIQVFKDYLSDNPVKYTYEELYNIDKAYDNYKPNKVTTPSSSILIVNGKLSSEALYNQVLKNNDEYYNDTKNNNARAFFNELKNKEIKEICDVISEVVNYEVEKENLNILDISKNLEHLKIFEDSAAFNNASVNNDMCLSVNKRFIEKIF